MRSAKQKAATSRTDKRAKSSSQLAKAKTNLAKAATALAKSVQPKYGYNKPLYFIDHRANCICEGNPTAISQVENKLVETEQTLASKKEKFLGTKTEIYYELVTSNGIVVKNEEEVYSDYQKIAFQFAKLNTERLSLMS